MLNLNSRMPDDPDTNPNQRPLTQAKRDQPHMRRHPGRSSEPGSIIPLGLHGTEGGKGRDHNSGLRKWTGTMDPGLHGNRGDGGIHFSPSPFLRPDDTINPALTRCLTKDNT